MLSNYVIFVNKREGSRTAARPDNLEQVYGSFIYNQLFIKNISN